MKKMILLAIVLAFSKCGNKYVLEQNSVLKFKEANYKSWSSGVRNGGAGYSIYITLEDTLDTEKNKISLEGIYFKKKYAKLKFQGNNKFQGNIISKKSTISQGGETLFNEKVKKESESKKDEIKIPFELKANEAVIAYTEKGKEKFIKIKLNKKQSIQFPM